VYTPLHKRGLDAEPPHADVWSDLKIDAGLPAHIPNCSCIHLP